MGAASTTNKRVLVYFTIRYHINSIGRGFTCFNTGTDFCLISNYRHFNDFIWKLSNWIFITTNWRQFNLSIRWQHLVTWASTKQSSVWTTRIIVFILLICIVFLCSKRHLIFISFSHGAFSFGSWGFGFLYRLKLFFISQAFFTWTTSQNKSFSTIRLLIHSFSWISLTMSGLFKMQFMISTSTNWNSLIKFGFIIVFFETSAVCFTNTCANQKH